MSKMASDEALWRKLVRAAGENEYELGALEAVGERTGVVWVCRGPSDYAGEECGWINWHTMTSCEICGWRRPKRKRS